MKAVIEEGEGDIPARMQLLALTEGALPRHLYTALFTQTSDGRLLTHRQLSRHLVSLWAAENPSAVDLLGRTVVRGELVLVFYSAFVQILYWVQNNIKLGFGYLYIYAYSGEVMD